jgi:hypothetical protein
VFGYFLVDLARSMLYWTNSSRRASIENTNGWSHLPVRNKGRGLQAFQ